MTHPMQKKPTIKSTLRAPKKEQIDIEDVMEDFRVKVDKKHIKKHKKR